MNARLPLFILYAICCFSLISCSPHDQDDQKAQSLTNFNLTTTPSVKDLIGSWGLSKMNADTAVDLDRNGSSSQNLLTESTCFNDMDIVFTSDMNFTTINRKLDFNGGDKGDQLICTLGRSDFGTWDLRDDILVLNINIDGTVYTQEKQLLYNGETFSFPVSRSESKQYYNDPGTTSVSQLQILNLEYSRM